MKGQRRSYVLDGLLLLGLCLLFFWRDLTPVTADRRQFASGDFSAEFYAAAHYANMRLADGALPLWTPYQNAGHPFLADTQVAFFYPPRLLNLLLARRGDFPSRALEVEALLHFPLVALSTYLLARRLAGSRAGGLLAACIFTFSSYLTGYPILQLAILESVAWLPLILLCLDLAAERLQLERRTAAARWTAAGGALLAVSLLAGHPQTGLLVAYGSLAFFLYRLWPRPFTHSWSTWRARLALAALFGLAGAAIAAVQLLPALEFMRLSSRAAIGIDEAGSGFLPYDLLQIILPAVGVPFTALYVGILPLGLAALAIALPGRARPWPAPAHDTVPFWAGSGLVALLLSFGQHLPVYPIFYLLLPGWALFRHQERMVAWAVLALALLAGYGAAWLCRRLPVQNGTEAAAGTGLFPAQVLPRAYGWAALATLGLALAFFVGYQAGRSELWGFTTACLYLAAILALSGLALRSRQAVFLAAVLLLDLFTVNPLIHSQPAGKAAVAPQPALALAQADPDRYRVAIEGVLPENHGDLLGVESTGGVSPLQLAAYRTLLEQVPAARVWRLLNVKYIASARETLDVPAERVSSGQDAAGKPYYLHRLADPAPRAWLAGQVIPMPDGDELWKRLADAGFDPAQQVLLAVRPAGYQDAPGCTGRVTWQERRPELLALDVESEQTCVLVLSELAYPGWSAGIDGVGAPILRADGVLRAVVVPAGRHRVSMQFWPLSLLWGAAISALALLLLAGWLLWGLRRPNPGQQRVTAGQPAGGSG